MLVRIGKLNVGTGISLKNENNCRNCSCKNYTVSLIGIDVDTRDKKINNLIMERIKKHGTFTRKRSTNGGWHYKVNLNKIRIIKDLSDKIDLILLRFWIGDDPT